MGVREKERFLEQWRMDATDLRRRMILAPTPRERERWYAILLLAQGLTAAATAEALERDPHTIGRRASAFGEGGAACPSPSLHPRAQPATGLSETPRAGNQGRHPTGLKAGPERVRQHVV